MAIRCEVCNSENLVKNDGVFVCQSCGIKYSLEEIRRMLLKSNSLGPNNENGNSSIKTDNKYLAMKYDKGGVNSQFILQALKSEEIDVNCEWENENEKVCLLTSAIIKQDHELINYLLENGCDPNVEIFVRTDAQNATYNTPLHLAIVNQQDIGLFDKLLSYGADPHKKIRDEIRGIQCEHTILQNAVATCSPEVVKHIILAGVKPNETSYYGYDSVPLMSAIDYERYDNAKILLDNGANIEFIFKTSIADYTVLNWAIINGRTTGVDFLLRAGANPNCVRVLHYRLQQAEAYFPALYDAVSKNNFDMVRALIKAGADVNCYADDRGWKMSVFHVVRDERMDELLSSYSK